ncbi:hypothetical protein O6H91_03G105700 [Diphasiastrum complanatum]|uniref:Uncharacterized protein n=1 Tax=Diphasiastrum complanatum TaxID=34168 RepID=A0ACC2EAE3_DIPCM|nr:hypothetical protein O6H91_03G105700 [Diphasiastrum complanatum]
MEVLQKLIPMPYIRSISRMKNAQTVPDDKRIANFLNLGFKEQTIKSKTAVKSSSKCKKRSSKEGIAERRSNRNRNRSRQSHIWSEDKNFDEATRDDDSQENSERLPSFNFRPSMMIQSPKNPEQCEVERISNERNNGVFCSSIQLGSVFVCSIYTYEYNVGRIVFEDNCKLAFNKVSSS